MIKKDFTRSFELKEATIKEIHEYFKSGKLTCRELVEFYIDRINKFDKKGPSLNTVIKLNPKALEKADEPLPDGKMSIFPLIL